MSNETTNNPTLEEQLATIERLEEMYNLLGVSFAVKDSKTVLTAESADYVIRGIEEGLKHIKNRANLPKAVLRA